MKRAAASLRPSLNARGKHAAGKGKSTSAGGKGGSGSKSGGTSGASRPSLARRTAARAATAAKRVGGRAAKGSWAAARGFVQNKVMRRGKKNSKKNANGKKGGAFGNGAMFDIKGATLAQAMNGPIAPAKPTTTVPSRPKTNKSVPTAAREITTGGIMLANARAIEQWAAELHHPGFLAVLDELHHEFAPGATAIAEAVDILGDKIRKRWPVPEEVARKWEVMLDCAQTFAMLARQIPEDIEEIDAILLAELRSPSRNGSDMLGHDMQQRG